MLKLQDLDAGYGKVQVLKNISLSVKKERIVTLLGANGAGKSTTLKVICGLHRRSRGTITFCGRPIEKARPHDIVRRGISIVLEGRQLFVGMSVHENLELGAYTQRGKTNLQKNRDWVLDLFPPLAGRLYQQAETLSGGEQQMLAIGRALMAEPRMLVLDEPTLGLAPFLVDEIFKVLKRLNDSHITILLVEQNARRALEISHYGFLMENGRIVSEGTPGELEKNETIQKAYLGAI